MNYSPLHQTYVSAALAFLIMMCASCAHHSTTQQNIKKVNDAFAIKKTKNISATPIPPRTPDNVSTEAIPLSQFLDSKTPTTIQSINPQFSKLQEWSRVNLEIAKMERDVRNYDLSEKYSTEAVLWADRAIQIKDLPASEASIQVQLWVDALQWPDLPETVDYYYAWDVYEKILTTREILRNFKNRFCLVNRGVPIVPALAYLNLSIDLFNEKKYQKALYKIQNGLASVENVTPEEDSRCGENDDVESTD
jgi:hypothetical protein